MDNKEIKEHVELQIDLRMNTFEELESINEKIRDIKDGSPVLEDYIEELLSNNEITEDESYLMSELATEYYLKELNLLHEDITQKIQKYGKKNHDVFQASQKKKVENVMSLIFDNKK